jgi:hypothetical protein
LFGLRRVGDDARHGGVKLIERRERTPLPGAFGDPRRLLEDPAKRADELRSIGRAQLGDRHA